MVCKKNRIRGISKFVVPPSGGYCQADRLISQYPPEGGTTNFFRKELFETVRLL